MALGIHVHTDHTCAWIRACAAQKKWYKCQKCVFPVVFSASTLLFLHEISQESTCVAERSYWGLSWLTRLDDTTCTEGGRKAYTSCYITASPTTLPSRGGLLDSLFRSPGGVLVCAHGTWTLLKFSRFVCFLTHMQKMFELWKSLKCQKLDKRGVFKVDWLVTGVRYQVQMPGNSTGFEPDV